MSYITGRLHLIDTWRLHSTLDRAFERLEKLLAQSPDAPQLNLTLSRISALPEVWLVGLHDNFSRTQVHDEKASAEEYQHAIAKYYSFNDTRLIHLKADQEDMS